MLADLAAREDLSRPRIVMRVPAIIPDAARAVALVDYLTRSVLSVSRQLAYHSHKLAPNQG